ncbi:hypothetical protein LY78DRAFT_283862 [Colletotrichum sublineola]|nr:hypothetical protein LY78DRAFT_283862 [Colletotrichum sublineola]
MPLTACAPLYIVAAIMGTWPLTPHQVHAPDRHTDDLRKRSKKSARETMSTVQGERKCQG